MFIKLKVQKIRLLDFISKRSFPILALLTILHFLCILLYSISRHNALLSNMNDLGVFDQAIWGILNNKPFHNSFLFENDINTLSFHFFPAIALIAPFYYLYPTPIWLLVIQSIFLSATSFLIYYLPLQLSFSKNASLLFATIYLLDFRIINTAFFDFHEISLAIPLFAMTFIAIEKRRFFLFVVSLTFIALCKEHFGLSIFGFGLLWAVKNKDFFKGFIVCFFGLFHSAFVIFFLMPFFSNYDQHVMFIDNMGQLSRYGWIKSYIDKFGQESNASIIHILVQRLEFFHYSFSLFLPYLFIPIFGLKFLLPGLADFVANTLSANTMPRSLFAYHNASLSVIFLIACIYSLPHFAEKFNKFSINEILSLLFLINLIFFYFCTPFSFPHSKNSTWKLSRLSILPDPNISIIKSIVLDKPISAQANVGSFFTQRHSIYIFPDFNDAVRFSVLNLSNPTKHNPNLEVGHIGSLAHCLNMNPIAYLYEVRKMILSEDTSIAFWNDPWLVIERGNFSENYKKEIVFKLDRLLKEWDNSK